jgi:hypothetical protein
MPTSTTTSTTPPATSTPSTSATMRIEAKKAATKTRRHEEKGFTTEGTEDTEKELCAPRARGKIFFSASSVSSVVQFSSFFVPANALRSPCLRGESFWPPAPVCA